MHKGNRFEIDRHTSNALVKLLKDLPEKSNEDFLFPSTDNLQILEELDDTEGVSIVPFDVAKGGSLSRRRLVIPRSSSPQIGNKIDLKFGKNKRKCMY